MLPHLSQPNAPGVRADGHVKLLRHEHDDDALVDTAQATRVDLAEVHGTGEEQLFEHDAVVAVLAGGQAKTVGLADLLKVKQCKLMEALKNVQSHTYCHI